MSKNVNFGGTRLKLNKFNLKLWPNMEQLL